MLTLLLAALLLFFFFGPTTSSAPEVSYSTFLTQVASDQVKSVKLHHDSGQVDGTHVDGTTFTAQGPPGGIPDADIKLLDDHKVARDYAEQSSRLVADAASLPVAGGLDHRILRVDEP